jgi:hypothetical protein
MKKKLDLLQGTLDLRALQAETEYWDKMPCALATVPRATLEGV